MARSAQVLSQDFRKGGSRKSGSPFGLRKQPVSQEPSIFLLRSQLDELVQHLLYLSHGHQPITNIVEQLLRKFVDSFPWLMRPRTGAAVDQFMGHRVEAKEVVADPVFAELAPRAENVEQSDGIQNVGGLEGLLKSGHASWSTADSGLCLVMVLYRVGVSETPLEQGRTLPYVTFLFHCK